MKQNRNIYQYARERTGFIQKAGVIMVRKKSSIEANGF